MLQYPHRHLRDRLEDVRGRSLALPSTSSAALATSDTEEDESSNTFELLSNDYEDLDHGKVHEPMTNSANASSKKAKILQNIAQRKKLATPAPSTKENTSRTSLVDESIYSSVSNETYSKINTASVIEVIEPTASEEEEFKQALREMNWNSSNSPLTIFPRQDELRSSIMTNQSNSPVMKHHARPATAIIRSSPTSSKASRESIRSRYSNELTPTKKLMEMGISLKVKRSPLPMQMYANLEDEDFNQDQDVQAEEHILPDDFDEVEVQEVEKSSISPASRKSASSSKGSQDSGIAGIVKHHSGHKLKMEVNKAWYDVPSDDETEAPEADSLASIISHRDQSSEDEH